MSRRRATRPLIRYSLCPLRYKRRLTTTSPGFATISGFSAFFFFLLFKNAGSLPAATILASVSAAGSVGSDASSAGTASTIGIVLSAGISSGITVSAIIGISEFSVLLCVLCDSVASLSSAFSPPSITNRAASASSGSSIVIVTSARPSGGRFTVPLKMQSLIRPARRLLWLCSPSTHEIASTTFDLPQPFGPTMHVVPVPLNVTTVRSQNDLNPVISTFLSLSKVSPLVSSRLPYARGRAHDARRETTQYSPFGGVFSQHPNRVAVEGSLQR